MLQFNDGVNLDTDGPLRVVEMADGWYVLGNGMSIPVRDREEGEQVLRDLKEEGLQP